MVDFIDDLDAFSVYDAELEPDRTHLGASQIGNVCVRAAWMSFRKIKRVRFEGRMHRLFKRGHEEEHRLNRYLLGMGLELRPYAQQLVMEDRGCQGGIVYSAYEWDTHTLAYDETDVTLDRKHVEIAEQEFGVKLRQWNFKANGGHHSGSNDGKVKGFDKYDERCVGWGGLEYKTHGESSFTQLAGPKPVTGERRKGGKGVLKGKPVHYTQVQNYMDRLDLPWCLYIAVNKNTDEIYYEVIMRKRELGKIIADRAEKIVEARQAPGKAFTDPSNFNCKFCDFADECHYSKQPEVSCFSCAYCVPITDDPENKAEWRCNKYNQIVPKDFMWKGCDKWDSIL